MKNIWQSIKDQIYQPVEDIKCVCGQQLPFDFFVDGGKCPNCKLQIYETKKKQVIKSKETEYEAHENSQGHNRKPSNDGSSEIMFFALIIIVGLVVLLIHFNK